MPWTLQLLNDVRPLVALSQQGSQFHCNQHFSLCSAIHPFIPHCSHARPEFKVRNVLNFCFSSSLTCFLTLWLLCWIKLWWKTTWDQKQGDGTVLTGMDGFTSGTLFWPSHSKFSVPMICFNAQAGLTLGHKHPLYTCPFLLWGSSSVELEMALSLPKSGHTQFTLYAGNPPTHLSPEALAFWPRVWYQSFVSLNHMEHISPSYGSHPSPLPLKSKKGSNLWHLGMGRGHSQWGNKAFQRNLFIHPNPIPL